MGLTKIDQSLFAIYFTIVLDSLGLLILGTNVRSCSAVLQGVGQLAIAAGGVVLELGEQTGDLVLVWLLAILALLVTRYFLHKHVATAKLLRQVKADQRGLSPELLVYFCASLFVKYSGASRLCLADTCGSHCWTLAFGTTAVLLFTLGGMGFLTIRFDKPLLYAVRFSIAMGTVSLVKGCWLAIR